MSRILYPIRAEPVLTDAQRPEQVTESRWHQPLSLPVRRIGLIAAAIVASGLVVAPVYVPPVPTDGWVQPISQPVRRLVRPQPAAFSYSYNTPVAETVTLDKWFAPASLPTRRRGLPVSLQDTFAFAQSEPIVDPASVAGPWWQPLSQPTYRKRTVHPPALVWSGFTPASIEVVSVDKWFVPLAAPRFSRGLPVSRQRALAFYPLPLVAAVTHELAAALVGIASIDAMPTSTDDDILDSAELIYTAAIVVGTVPAR